MSRAFIKENDLEHASIDLPERPLSNRPNYVTANGLKLLNTQIDTLKMQREKLKQNKDDSLINQKIAMIERDMRYYAAQIESAIIALPQNEDYGTVLFGAKVTVENEDGTISTFEIVGEDEANVYQGKVSFVSPLAEALIGSKIGDEVLWAKPMGDTYLIIRNIEY